MGLVTYLRNTLSLGDRLAEFFYGVTMVAVVSGMINTTLPPGEEKIRLLLLVSLAVNISWGIIDGVTGLYAGMVDRAEQDLLVDALRGDTENPEKRDAVLTTLQGTILDDLDETDRTSVVDLIVVKSPGVRQKYTASADDLRVAGAIFLIDVVLVFPVILPFFVFGDVGTAVFVSHAIAILSLALCAMIWARHLRRNIWIAGLVIGLIAAVGIGITYYLGW